MCLQSFASSTLLFTAGVSNRFVVHCTFVVVELLLYCWCNRNIKYNFFRSSSEANIDSRIQISYWLGLTIVFFLFRRYGLTILLKNIWFIVEELVRLSSSFNRLSFEQKSFKTCRLTEQYNYWRARECSNLFIFLKELNKWMFYFMNHS